MDFSSYDRFDNFSVQIRYLEYLNNNQYQNI